eukprot:6485161-Amphidinium_carterae.3
MVQTVDHLNASRNHSFVYNRQSTAATADLSHTVAGLSTLRSMSSSPTSTVGLSGSFYSGHDYPHMIWPSNLRPHEDWNEKIAGSCPEFICF